VTPDQGGDDPGFRVVDEDTVWKGRRLRVAVARIAGLDGTIHEREVVHHPGAVSVVPLHEDGSVTLVRQYRAAVDRLVLELPAGLRDVEGEPTVVTAERELVEEAGLSATELRHLITFNNSPGFSDEALVIYLGTGLTPVPDNRQGPEEQLMQVERMPLDTAVDMVLDGRITDAKTIIGLLLTDRMASPPQEHPGT
jgi:8-oxo-dGTP pyrophosphatase MutT (NUDIX family)